MTDPGRIWSSFTLDPRRPEYAPLRASDQDRNVVHQVLADAYADGRLDRDEFETRTADVAGAKTLGELAGLVEGLVPTADVPAVRPGRELLSDTKIQERAVSSWQEARRNALWGFFSASLICWVIWAVTSQGFPWPVFVMLGTGLNLGRVQFQRQAIIEEERRKLEKKQAREIEKRRRREEPE
jgi:hypothetical protein